jgi:hypothetical protein
MEQNQFNNTPTESSLPHHIHKIWKIIACIAIVIAIILLVVFLSNKQKLSEVKGDLLSFQKTLSELSPEMSAAVLKAVSTTKIPTTEPVTEAYVIWYNSSNGTCILVYADGSTSPQGSTVSGGCLVHGETFPRVVQNNNNEVSIISAFQKRGNIPVTGKIDITTSTKLNTLIAISKEEIYKQSISTEKSVTLGSYSNPIPITFYINNGDGTCSVEGVTGTGQIEALSDTLSVCMISGTPYWMVLPPTGNGTESFPDEIVLKSGKKVIVKYVKLDPTQKTKIVEFKNLIKAILDYSQN